MIRSRRGLRRARTHPGARPLGYVAGAYPQLSETFVLDELRELGRQGARPQVVAMFRGDGELDGAPPALYLDGARAGDVLRSAIRLTLTHPVRLLTALSVRRRRLGASARELFALAPAALRLRHAKHLHAHFATDPATYAERLAALTGASFSFTAHAYDIHLIRDRLDEKLAGARFVLTPTAYNRGVLLGRPGGCSATVLHHPNGIDLERFRRRTPYRPDGPLVGVGRLVPKKGFHVAIEALARTGERVPPFVLAGDGPDAERLRALAAERGVAARFLGALPHAEVPALLEQASALLLPCVPLESGDRDAAPTVLLEAMALELPVVTSAMAGVDELVGDDRGVLARPGEPSDLARALDDLYARGADERREMGRVGRAYVARHHDLSRQVERLRTMFALAGAR